MQNKTVHIDRPRVLYIGPAAQRLLRPWLRRDADGFSILGQIRSLHAENALTLTPVVIFSDSQDPGNITRSYRCGANGYIMKPVSFSDFQAVVKSIGQFWMTHNRRAA